MNQFKNFTKGLIKENPVFVLLLGMCPVLGVTSSAINGMGMGLATAFVLVMSNMAIALIKNVIPDKVRIPAFVVVIASFVTVVEMVMEGFLPDLYNQLGLFIPLIVVNCLILGRAEAFASKNNVISSFFDGLGMGLGFTLGLVVLGATREILGAGTIFNVPFVGEDANTLLLFVLPPGAFIALGYLIAGINQLKKVNN
ncbi:MAG: electron transport complex subunit E [Bacteroidales bacterium]|nr:electron transport complex subunit E [Bacteroidales bacterium]NLK80899.1 electron transport complex subunit E [Bacteroidales bacterium]